MALFLPDPQASGGPLPHRRAVCDPRAIIAAEKSTASTRAKGGPTVVPDNQCRIQYPAQPHGHPLPERQDSAEPFLGKGDDNGKRRRCRFLELGRVKVPQMFGFWFHLNLSRK